MTPPTDVDAVVIGAGPAGGRAALGLARAGRRVLLVEKQAWPRPKVCGCCLNAAALACLHRAGLAPPLAVLAPPPLRTLEMRAGRHRARLELPPGVALSRPALDALLVDAAVRAGATFRPGTSAHVAPAAPHDTVHRVTLGDQTVRAACVVVADGLAGTALRDWPAFAPVTRPAARIGLGVHLPADHPVGGLFGGQGITMLCGRHGYLGLVRLEHGAIDLAAAADRTALKRAGGPAGLAQAIAADADAADAFTHANTWPWRLTPPLTRARSRLAGSGLFVVGDAAGYVEPFTGEGMAWALAGGEAVVPHALGAIEAWAPRAAAAWSTTHRRIVARRQRSCLVVAALLRRPRLTRGAVRVLAVAPALAAPLIPPARQRTQGMAA